VIANQVCIPGCLMYLGQLLVTSKKQRSEQQQQQQQQQQQWVPPACQDGTWTVQLSNSAATASSINSRSSATRPAAGAAAAAAAAPSLLYQTLDDLDAAARDGTLQAGIQGVLQRQAIEPCPSSHVVATWGSRLQLALWWQVQQQQRQQFRWTRQRQQQATLAAAAAAGSGSSSAAMDGAGLCVRAVLSLGSRVLLDMQQLLPHVAPPAAAAAAAAGVPGFHWCSMQIDLPPASGSSSSNSGAASSSSTLSTIEGNRRSSSGSSSGATAVLTLYILPAGSSAPGGECAPLGYVTLLLLLPRDAAAELSGFVEQNRFTQQLLQPLLTDMAVAVAEGTALRSSGGNITDLSAAAAAWSADHACNSSGRDGISADDATLDYLAAACEAAGKVRQFLSSVGTQERCEELVSACHQALLAAYASQATS
jgi:hypothetical protein